MICGGTVIVNPNTRLSKTDAAWVRDFIDRYGERLSSLAIREGSKYLA